MTKARIISLMFFAALFAYVLAMAGRTFFGMSDGGGW